jgi:transcriptional regulator with XRE-family HTH domain
MNENLPRRKVRLVPPLHATYFGQVGKYFRDKRLKKGMTQEDVSKFLGYTSKQIVSNWERGACHPPIDVIKKLIVLLDLNPEEVLKLFMTVTKKELMERFGVTTGSKLKKAG